MNAETGFRHDQAEVEKRPTFKHTPLIEPSTSIRLLKLRRNDPIPKQLDTQQQQETAITLTLEVFLLQEMPTYRALSYMWGPSAPLVSVGINECTFEIRENLSQFLSMYSRRQECEDIYLWVDQLCIDQANDRERSSQVGIMARIYKSAIEVLVWVGNEEGERIDYIERLIKERSDLEKAAARALFRSYWQRLWIVQEVVLARHVRLFCGSHECSNTILMKALSSFHAVLFWHPLHSRLIGSAGSLTLAQAISSHSDKTCQESRDNIFGLLSLVREDERVRVNYSATIIDVKMESALIVCKSRLLNRVGEKEMETAFMQLAMLRPLGFRGGLLPWVKCRDTKENVYRKMWEPYSLKKAVQSFVDDMANPPSQLVSEIEALLKNWIRRIEDRTW